MTYPIARSLVGWAGVLAGLLALDSLAAETAAPPSRADRRQGGRPARRAGPAGRGRRGDAGGAVRRGDRGARTARRERPRRPTRGPITPSIRGIGERLAGKADAARRTLGDALKAAPEGPLGGQDPASSWPPSSSPPGSPPRPRRWPAAEAETLLAGDRKDRLAEVYHAFARRLLKPDDPIAPPDPEAAYDLLAQARGLAKGEALRARLLLAMGRASQAAGNHGRAIAGLPGLPQGVPQGGRPARRPVPPGRGPARRRPGPGRPADLDRPGPRPRRRKDRPEGRPTTIRARALYEIAHDLRHPQPARRHRA